MSWLAIYDGSFPGLLCLAAEALGPAGPPSAVGTNASTQLTLFDEPRQVVTEPARAAACWRNLGRHLSRDSLRNLATVHLHGAGGHELAVVGYLRLGLERGHDLDSCLTAPDVAEIHRRAGQVRLESHRLKGLVRFRRLRDGGYYAPLHPDHRVLYAVARHFVRRLHNETWLLHDTGRGEALYWDQHELRELTLSSDFAAAAANFAAEEAGAEDLWRMFHRTVAVPGRENPRVQRQFMPRRYWPYLIEAVGKPGP
jgi:probable DNA metabolism protein